MAVVVHTPIPSPTSSGSTRSTVHVSLPYGEIGDVVFIVLVNDDATTTEPMWTLTCPDTYTLLAEAGDATPDAHVSLWYRIIDGTETAAMASFASAGGADYNKGFAFRVSGLDTADLVEGTGTDYAGNGLSAAVTGVTTAAASLAMVFWATDGSDCGPVTLSGTGWPTSPNYENHEPDGSRLASGSAFGMAYYMQSGAGATNTVTISLASNDGCAAFQIAFNVKTTLYITEATSHFDVEDTTVTITGLGFGASQGTGTVYLSDATTLAGSANEVDIGNAITSWSDTSITLTLSGLTGTDLTNLATLGYGQRYLIVKTNGGSETYRGTLFHSTACQQLRYFRDYGTASESNYRIPRMATTGIDGDLYLALFGNSVTGAQNIVTPTSTFRPCATAGGIFDEDNAGATETDARFQALYYVSTSSDAEYFTLEQEAVTGSIACAYLLIVNADVDNPIDVVGSSEGSNTGTITMPALTTLADGSLVIAGLGTHGSDLSGSFSGTGWSSGTQAHDGFTGGNAAGVTCAWSSKTVSTAGTSGDCTFTPTLADDVGGIQFAIAPKGTTTGTWEKGIVPTGDGGTDEWTGAYTDVDEGLAVNDSTSAVPTANGDTFRTTINPTGNGTDVANRVKIGLRVIESGTHTDDTGYSLSCKIMDGATVLAAADSGGTSQPMFKPDSATPSFVAGSYHIGEREFAYVNPDAALAAWQGAEVIWTYAVTAVSTEDSAKIGLHAYDVAIEWVTGTAPTNVNLGLASETDSALSMSAAGTGTGAKAIGLASETSSALAMTPTGAGTVAVALAQAAEVDSPLAITAAPTGTAPVAIGLASEVDSPLALTATPTGAASVAIGQATSTESALSIAATSPVSVNLGIASETDSALVLTPTGTGTGAKAVGLASETDSALTMSASTGASLVDLGLASETGTPYAIIAAATGTVSVALALLSTTETPLAMTATPLGTAAFALGLLSTTETPLAIAGVGTGTGAVDLGLASETDAALGITPTAGTSVALGLASETSAIYALSADAVGTASVALGLLTETGTPYGLTPIGTGSVEVAIGFLTTSETAQALTPTGAGTVSIALGAASDATTIYGVSALASGTASASLGVAVEVTSVYAILASKTLEHVLPGRTYESVPDSYGRTYESISESYGRNYASDEGDGRTYKVPTGSGRTHGA